MWHFTDIKYGHFHVALGLWVESISISCYVYAQLHEVLCLLDMDEVYKLPYKLDTLKWHLHDHIPMLCIQEDQIKVIKHVQPTKCCPLEDNTV